MNSSRNSSEITHNDRVDEDICSESQVLLGLEYPVGKHSHLRPWRFPRCVNRIMLQLRRRLPQNYISTTSRVENKTEHDILEHRSPRDLRCPNRSLRKVLVVFLCVGVFCLLALSRLRSPDMQRSRPIWADLKRTRDWTISQRVSCFSTEDINPLPCLSHNDESRAIPLFTGLSYGCLAVEADIWLRNGSLLVGHDAQSLCSDDSLESMYLEPLQRILEGTSGQPSVRGRVYQNQSAWDPFVLMLDFKSQARLEAIKTLTALEKALHPLRQAQLLTHYDSHQEAVVKRALTIVASGDVPFDLLVSNNNTRYRDVFFDAPLRWIWEDQTGREQLGRRPGKGQGRAGTSTLTSAAVFDQRNSYLASMSFKSLYWPPFLGLSKRQKAEIKEQIDAAHKKRLKVRYWGTWDSVLQAPGRRRLWRQLTELGVDVMNVDALEEYAASSWDSAYW